MPEEKVLEKEPKETKEVVVELDQDNEPIKPAEPKKEEPKYVRIEDLNKINLAINNTRQWNERKVATLEEKLDKIVSKLQTPQVPVTAAVNGNIDEDDILVQKDWKAAVDKRSERKAQEVFQKLRQLETQQAEMQAKQQEATVQLENSKREVLERHPELNDPAHDKTTLFQQILSEKPHYLYNPLGPTLAMRDMEERLREQGRIDEPTKHIVEKELTRRARTSASVIPQGTSSPSNKVVLSKEQKEFCDQQGIKYEAYARMFKIQQNQEGVEAR